MNSTSSPVSSPTIGAPLTLSLHIADEENVASYQAAVQFNTFLLRYIESTDEDNLPKSAFFVLVVVDANRVTFAQRL